MYDYEKVGPLAFAFLALSNSFQRNDENVEGCAIRTTQELYAWALPIWILAEISVDNNYTKNRMSSYLLKGSNSKQEILERISGCFDANRLYQNRFDDLGMSDSAALLVQEFIVHCAEQISRRLLYIFNAGAPLHDDKSVIPLFSEKVYNTALYLIEQTDLRILHEFIDFERAWQPIRSALDHDLNGLIRDPFFETFMGIDLLILGLTPVSFTKRTEKGDKIYTKISMILWDIEREKTPNTSSWEVHFRIFKLIEFLKQRTVISFRQKEAEEEQREK